MQLKPALIACAAATAALLALPAAAKPTITWQAPAAGGALSGNVQGPPDCVVTGTDIARVMFYINGVWTNTDGNLSNGLGCWIDTTQYANGSYTLKAVAYNAKGQSASASRNIVIHNPLAISWQAPLEGGALSGNVQGPPSCVVTGTNISYVRFYINGVWTNTDGNLSNGLGCWIDTTQYANGAYTLKAVAYDGAGNSAEATRGIVIENAPASAGAIDAADILSAGSAEAAFAEQSGYSVQVLGTQPSIGSVPESGVHGDVLPNGETLRFGKVVDPLDSAGKALAFQVHPMDPNTSGAKRTELRMPNNIEMDKVYWIALSAYVYDWGTLGSADQALFAMQVHSGDDSLGLSPSIALVTAYGGDGRSFQVFTTSSASTRSTRYATQPIPFGRWVDFVVKFKHNTAGAGLLQVWMDGTQIVEHQGSLGHDTPGFKDYAKFGYYNWSGSSMGASARKVLLRSPTLVADPTGTKYTPEQLRAHIRGAQ